ncbi:hypothetical protein DYB37_013572 [Aphanomyces astaci]|uniref:Uncharacterized protein n=1 Tax=Aphanomyces astaci TaxID=112090 RepID=A0A397ET18_APHAT|nr:hypothetical protein AaE_015606 [Aphanomyces astaci]RHY09139.1 hypothetical protein DYB25_005276 [Aphanomyces astaci]RHY17109.1 hypothetical protein DYB36_007994 [Aphanomyces astaci]RHY50623.1 hypothetical protein DYB38_001586 [Aphanomyces astaci]RHY61681.1 hypothetical protein DYB34_006124 [Aphanomyces astaci]
MPALTKLDSTLDDDRVVCVFHVSQPPTTILSSSILTVYISEASVTIDHHNKTAAISAAELRVEQLSERAVVLHCADQKSTVHLEFTSPLEALHFVGAVHLIQHIDALRHPPLQVCTLEHQLKLTLEYAENLWALDLWKQSASYYSFVETLTCAAQELTCDDVHLGAVQKMLDALCDRFSSDASFDQTIEMDGYYCISPLLVLLAKVKALSKHVSWSTLR